MKEIKITLKQTEIGWVGYVKGKYNNKSTDTIQGNFYYSSPTPACWSICEDIRKIDETLNRIIDENKLLKD